MRGQASTNETVAHAGDGDRASFLVGLIGSGIGPSLTPPMHEREAAELGRRLIYRTIDIDELGVAPQAVGELVRSALGFGFNGLNITHPCKQLVLPFLDDITPDAQDLGAVNTVTFHGQSVTGHNTDWSAFAQSLELGLPEVRKERVVQLGAGGAGAAVAHALMVSGVQDLVIADPEAARASRLAGDLAERFPDRRCRAAAPGEVDEHVAHADGLVNATPIGMAHHPGVPLSPVLLRPPLWVADIVYRPLRTELLVEAERRGCGTLSGGGMAVLQAAQAFELITGLTSDHARMFAHFDSLARDR